uniref:Uncharacterized protein n=1 Tax=Glossina austeni TaxID=7395 RepID=A0A1A9VGJ3_GLOAU
MNHQEKVLVTPTERKKKKRIKMKQNADLFPDWFNGRQCFFPKAKYGISRPCFKSAINVHQTVTVSTTTTTTTTTTKGKHDIKFVSEKYRLNHFFLFMFGSSSTKIVYNFQWNNAREYFNVMPKTILLLAAMSL